VPDDLIVSEEDAFDLLVYLLSAAEITIFEPELYGTFRLVDAASRLLESMLENASSENRAFYEELKAEIDQKKVWMMWDTEGYLEFLRTTPAQVAEKLKQRQHAAADDR
jgi:hypothetical protein